MKKRILIVNQHYKMGGIKKTLDVFLREMKQYYDIDIQFLEKPRGAIDLPLDIKVLPCSGLLAIYKTALSDLKKEKRSLLCFLIKAILKILTIIFGKESITHFLILLSPKNKTKYDCVIVYSHDCFTNGSFNGGGNYLALKKVDAKKKLSWIHGELDYIGMTAERAKTTYSDFDGVVCVSDSMKRKFDIMCNNEIKSYFIRNMFDWNAVQEKGNEELDITLPNKINIVTVSRLDSTAKRSDKINHIAKIMREKGIDFHWTVIGGGNNLQELVQVSKDLAVDNCVNYIGEQTNPYKYVKRSDVFVLPSDSEAYPTVIVESLMLGVPVVSTNFDSAYQLLEDNKNSLIVEKDVNAIARALISLIEDRGLLLKLQENAKATQYENKESVLKVRELIDK